MCRGLASDIGHHALGAVQREADTGREHGDTRYHQLTPKVKQPRKLPVPVLVRVPVGLGGWEEWAVTRQTQPMHIPTLYITRFKENKKPERVVDEEGQGVAKGSGTGKRQAGLQGWAGRHQGPTALPRPSSFGQAPPPRRPLIHGPAKRPSPADSTSPLCSAPSPPTAPLAASSLP